MSGGLFYRKKEIILPHRPLFHLQTVSIMLQINLNILMRKRNIRNPRQFLIRRAGINHVMATKILKNEVELLRMSHLEAICRELRCTPNEVFDWKPQAHETPLPEHHPLLKLSGKEAEAAFLAKLGNMSSDELREAMKKLGE